MTAATAPGGLVRRVLSAVRMNHNGVARGGIITPHPRPAATRPGPDAHTPWASIPVDPAANCGFATYLRRCEANR